METAVEVWERRRMVGWKVVMGLLVRSCVGIETIVDTEGRIRTIWERCSLIRL